MARVLEVDAAGVRAGSLQENRENLDDRQRAAFGADLSLSPQTPQAQWSGILAQMFAEVGEAAVRAALYGASLDHAQGSALDALGSLLDIPRLVGTRSRVTATLAGVAGTAVPAGTRARTTDGDEFRTLTDVALTTGDVQVDMEAVAVGPVQADAGTLTQIVTVVTGWETVTNAQDAVLGRDRQTDAQYRASLLRRTAHSSIGPLSGLEGALEAAEAGRVRVVENTSSAAIVVQGWPVNPHSILVVAEAGLAADVQRAVENHRGMGVGTMTAIVGALPNLADLAAISTLRLNLRPSIDWDGMDITNWNPGSSEDGPTIAASLTAYLAGRATTPVTVLWVGDRFVAVHAWSPESTPQFGTSRTMVSMGLSPTVATGSQGPFIRTTVRDLTVSVDVARQAGFPADGLATIRQAIHAVVDGYGAGQQVWANDILRAAEGVTGSRASNLSVQYEGQDVSGVVLPLDTIWRLTAANLTIVVT